jgi:hypothetical protein
MEQLYRAFLAKVSRNQVVRGDAGSYFARRTGSEPSQPTEERYISV